MGRTRVFALVFVAVVSGATWFAAPALHLSFLGILSAVIGAGFVAGWLAVAAIGLSLDLDGTGISAHHPTAAWLASGMEVWYEKLYQYLQDNFLADSRWAASVKHYFTEMVLFFAVFFGVFQPG